MSPTRRHQDTRPDVLFTLTPPPSAVSLSVSSNSIGTDGLLSLARAVKANRTLTDINIWGNCLEEPVCQVTWGSNASRLCLGHFGSILLPFRFSGS